MKIRQPGAFLWKKRWQEVEEIVDHWRETGRWWNGETEIEFYLVQAQRGLILLGYRDHDQQWFAKPVR